MLNEDDRKYVLNEFLRVIVGISDLEYQKRVWILGKGPEEDDYGETVNLFFDDVDPILNDYRNFGISKDQYQLLRKFRNEFEAFSDTHYHELEFIDTPEWGTIMAHAKDILKAFNYTRQT
jgi:hypothetical protein